VALERVDRSQESRRDRSASLIIWTAVICLFVGIGLLSTGHDDNNLFVAVSGIAVLLGGGVLVFSSIFLPRRGKEFLRHTNPWRSLLRGLLLVGVLGGSLGMGGLLLYGLEFNDPMNVRLGVLVMWLAIAFFVPLVFVSPPKETPDTHPRAVHLSLSELTDARSLGLEWPDDRPGLWIGIYDLNIVRSLDTMFLLANTPEGHRIFFAVSAWDVEDEHKDLKKLLEIDRDPYREEFERAGGDKWRTVFASTRNPNIISQIFADYEFYYGGLAQYPFIVAKGELDVWMDSLRKT